MFNNNVGIIIWKKTDKYRCIMNNCNIKENAKLDSYIKHIVYEDSYKKILETHEDQIINNPCKTNIDGKIILKYVPENIILEIRVQTNINVQLLSSLSHKVRNPLSDILGILPFFDKAKLNKHEKEYVQILKKSCHDIIAVMNDIIDIVNFNCGELKLNPEFVNVDNLMHECYNIILKDIENKKLILKTIIDEDVPKTIFADKTKLKQIIINLLKNAIQYTKFGSIIIHVSIFQKDPECQFEYVECKQPKCNIMFSIKDSGTGMDNVTKTLVESILGMNKNIANTHNYSGLGLIIAKYLCNLMGGNIWFKTELNIGSIFHFNIISQVS